MYFQETYTFKTRRKGDILIASLLFLGVISLTFAGDIKICPDNCTCCTVSQYSRDTAEAECNNLVWKRTYYPNIVQLKLRPAPNTDRCYLANFTAKLFPKLETLDLSNCSLTSIPPSGTNHFGALTAIDLSNNNIRNVPPNALDSYLQVSHIKFSNNPLNPHSPPALVSPALTEVILDSCNIQTLPPHTFNGTPNLKVLSLSNNNISVLHEKTFPRGLSTLDLSKNRIVNVPTNEFLKLPNLSELNLSGNPVNCTCELVRFQDWLSGRPTMFVGGITCAYPHKYSGRDSSRIRENDLCVSEDTSFSRQKCAANSICNNGPSIDDGYVKDQRMDENVRALKDDELIPLNEIQGDEPPKDEVEGSGDEGDETIMPSSSTEKTTAEGINATNTESSSLNASISDDGVIRVQNELDTKEDESSAGTSLTTPPISSATLPSSSPANDPVNNASTKTSEVLNKTSENPSNESSNSSLAETTVGPSNGSSESASNETAKAQTSESPSNETTGVQTPESPSNETAGAQTSESQSNETTGAQTSESPSNETAKAQTSESPSNETTGAQTPESPSNETAGAQTSESSSNETSDTETAGSPSNESEAKTSENTSIETSTNPPNTPSVAPSNESSGLASNTSQHISGEKGTENRKESLHSSERKEIYGYLIPGLAVLLIGLVCLAVYCSQCASKDNTYKEPETNLEGAELQEVSLLSDSHHATIVKHSNKYPGEKENGQTERLMGDHDQTNGGNNIKAEVNGNGSQHSDETIDCCKLVNGQSAPNQNDLGNVECTVVKVTTLPDSVPKTAVIRDL